MKAFIVSGHHCRIQVVGETDRACPLYGCFEWLNDTGTILGVDADGNFTIYGKIKDNYSLTPCDVPEWAVVDGKPEMYRRITGDFGHAIDRQKMPKGEVKPRADVLKPETVTPSSRPSKDGWTLVRRIDDKIEVVAAGGYDGLWCKGKRKYGVTPSSKEWRKGADGAEYQLAKAVA